MAKDSIDMAAVMREIAQGKKRDNTAYHEAMAQARQVFESAEAALGGPVEFRTKTKLKRNGRYVVKWSFKRLK